MFILLFLFWIILNGKITLEICVIGAIISGLVYAFMIRHLEYRRGGIRAMKNIGRILIYLCVLAKEIFVANLTAIRFVFSKDEIQPQIVFFKVPLKYEISKTILANSITLTPGTITVNIDNDVFCVHALDYTLAEDFENSIFIKLLMKMEENY